LIPSDASIAYHAEQADRYLLNAMNGLCMVDLGQLQVDNCDETSKFPFRFYAVRHRQYVLGERTRAQTGRPFGTGRIEVAGLGGARGCGLEQRRAK
jgi:hypothetical protein